MMANYGYALDSKARRTGWSKPAPFAETAKSAAPGNSTATANGLVALDQFEDVAVDDEGGEAQEEDQADLNEAFFYRQA